jgi:hypothetical protein
LFTEETHASKEKGCQEKETLTVKRDDTSRKTESLEKPLERSTSPGVFNWLRGGEIRGKDASVEK